MNNVKKSIGWADYTINPVKGLCPMHCKNLQGYEYCYAAGERGLYKRFKWNTEIRYVDPFWDFYELHKKPPSRIFVGSTIELFGDWVKPEWRQNIFGFCRSYPQHDFLFLTKLPQNLPTKFPGNCWAGATVTADSDLALALTNLSNVEAKIKYLSIEPLLVPICQSELGALQPPINRRLKQAGIHWIIIGQQTPVSKETQPRIEWVQEIVEAADIAGIPVFLKKAKGSKLFFLNWPFDEKYWNLFNRIHFTDFTDFILRAELRQEMPVGRD